jgi:uncharacterized protein
VSDFGFKDVTVLTRPSAGIGTVYVERLAAHSYDLVLLARRAERLKALPGKVSKAYGTNARVTGVDLTKEPDLANANLWDNYDAARSTLFAATQTWQPAPRDTAA